MKLDLTKIVRENIERKKETIEFEYKDLANTIFNCTGDIGESEFARELYNKGVVEVNSQTGKMLKDYIDKGYKGWVKEALFPVLDKIINEEK